MLIDFHTHCFPDRIAERAIAKLAHASGGLEPQTDGTLQGLKDLMEADGVDLSIVMSIATNEKQMTAVNDFASEVQCENVLAFGSVYPDSPNVLEELERIKAMGLKGVKFHPDYQNFFVDDEKMKPIYQKISRLGLITLFHAGQDYGYAPPYHGMPNRFLKALSWFDAPVVLAHWGGVGCGEQVIKTLCGLPIYLDTSFGYGALPRAIAMRILEKHGADKLVFGSDAPWHRPAWEKKLLESMDLDAADLEKIYHLNAEKLLRLV